MASRKSEGEPAQRLLSDLKSLRLNEALSRRTADGLAVEHLIATVAVHRSVRLISARLEAALAPLDLTTPRYEVLVLLSTSETGEYSLGELKRVMVIHAATMTYTVNSLVERKLVRRKQEKADGRALQVEITAAGRRLAAAATEALAGIDFGLEKLSIPEARKVATMLLNLRRP